MKLKKEKMDRKQRDLELYKLSKQVERNLVDNFNRIEIKESTHFNEKNFNKFCEIMKYDEKKENKKLTRREKRIQKRMERKKLRERVSIN